MSRVTRKDVAKLAGVSETIVSYVVNDNRYVEAEKKSRVLSAIEELNYVPNNIARSLSKKETNHYLFMTDDLDNDYFTSLLAEMESVLIEQDFFISLCKYRDNNSFLNQVFARQFDGLFISTSEISQASLNRISNMGIPTVYVLRNMKITIPDNISVLNPGLYMGAEKCIHHMCEQERKRILFLDRFVKSANDEIKGVDPRLQAFNNWKEQCFVWSKIVHTGNDYSLLKKNLSDIYRDEAKFDGIIAINDKVAVLALRSLQDLGIRVPEDVSIVGYDNNFLSGIFDPSITTVNVSKTAYAEKIISLMKDLKDREEVKRIRLPVDLIVRNSSLRREKNESEN